MILNLEYNKFNDLIKNRPLLHTMKGNLEDWGISNKLAKYIFKKSKGKKTLEIGSGLSTLIFMLSSSDHTCINPRELDKKKLFLEIENKNLDKNKLKFIQSKSENICHSLDEKYEIILIDGSHTFPWPIVEWFYLGILLKKNSIMILDDVDWWPVSILDLYMKKSDSWFFEFGDDRFSCFRSLKEGEDLISHKWEKQADIGCIFTGIC